MALNARKKKEVGEFEVFDVVYEDGSRISYRKVPSAELAGEDKDGAVMAYFEAQDRKIAEASGKSRGAIKTILPAAPGVSSAPGKKAPSL
ncbi:MAG TPA: hypothetical protein VKP60_00345 [Magnetospirillaceae bacterium]|nr:hypothetical protein [Magnetospirillaceae bacterium]